MSMLFFHGEASGVHFYALEPAPIPFAALAENIRLHEIDAVPIESAVSNVSGTRRLSYYPDATVMSGLHVDSASEAALTRIFLLHSGFSEQDAEDMLEGMHDVVEIDCPTTTLSELIAAHAIERVDLLKIDVEKSETEVLEGLADPDWPKVRQVVAEVHDHAGNLDRFTTLLREHDFRVAVEQDELLVGTEMYEVFARREATA
jgi:FkbM family methyltransferase